MISSLSRILSAFITLLLLVECSSNKTGMFMYFVDILLIFSVSQLLILVILTCRSKCN